MERSLGDGDWCWSCWLLFNLLHLLSESIVNLVGALILGVELIRLQVTEVSASVTQPDDEVRQDLECGEGLALVIPLEVLEERVHVRPDKGGSLDVELPGQECRCCF